MVRWLLVAVLAWVFACPSWAAGPLVAPRLEVGRHVYVLPSDYRPPGVSAAGVERLERELAALHHPFYAVFVDELPSLDAAQRRWAHENGFEGDRETKQVEVATARLVVSAGPHAAAPSRAHTSSRCPWSLSPISTPPSGK